MPKIRRLEKKKAQRYQCTLEQTREQLELLSKIDLSKATMPI